MPLVTKSCTVIEVIMSGIQNFSNKYLDLPSLCSSSDYMYLPTLRYSLSIETYN